MNELKEALIEFESGMDAHGFEFLIQRSDFDQSSDVAACANGDDDVGELDAEDFVGEGSKSGAVEVFAFIPFLERCDEVEAFFRADGADTEDGSDVDDAYAADFHVVAGEVGRHPYDFAAIYETETGDVVANETVTALDEAEDAFAFADAGGAPDEGSDAHDVHHAAVLGCLWRKLGFEDERSRVSEFHGDHRRAEERRAVGFGNF